VLVKFYSSIPHSFSLSICLPMNSFMDWARRGLITKITTRQNSHK